MRDVPYFDKASSWKATRALLNGIDLNSIDKKDGRTFDCQEGYKLTFLHHYIPLLNGVIITVVRRD